VARYRFSTSNGVWAIVRRFYEAYFVRVRVFPEAPVPACPMGSRLPGAQQQEGLLLPKVGRCGEDRPVLGGGDVTRELTSLLGGGEVRRGAREQEELTSLLVTSLLSDYYERIRCVYFTSPTAGHRGVRDGAPAQPRDRGRRGQPELIN
jgi:xyloglucan fucosyltransferase